MGGHVNMMDDALVASLPPDYLRSTLRALLRLGPQVQQPFKEHVQQLLLNPQPAYPGKEVLFPGNDIVSRECQEYMSMTRCLFASKLAEQSIPYISHLISSLEHSHVLWSPNSQLEHTLDTFDGDIVQAMQALKETTTTSTESLVKQLDTLLSSLANFKSHCTSQGLTNPLQRSERQVQDTRAYLFPNSARNATAQRPHLSVSLPANSRMETFHLGGRTVPRLFVGLWQLASPQWGSANAAMQEQGLSRLVENGFVAADMADHYGDAELVYGDFRLRMPPEIQPAIYAATKWCVFRDIGRAVTPDWVLNQMEERCRRLSGRVDLLQFHWHDYGKKEYLDILVELVKITETHPHLVSSIGLCNFNAERTLEACEYVQEKTGSVGLISNQVQFSIVDSRPLMKMCGVCDKYGLKLLTYGSYCGGFLSSSWLGKPAPEPYNYDSRLTPSQRKYLESIYAWGTWEDFQQALKVLDTCAQKYGVSISNVAARWVLQQDCVGAVLVGTRLGVSGRESDNLDTFGWEIDEEDMKMINDTVLGHGMEKMEHMYRKMGDCGDEYRRGQ